MLIVHVEASAPHTHILPALAASKIAKCVTAPQFAVGAGKVTALLFDVAPPVPVEAVVEPTDCVPAQFASELVTAARA